MSTNKQIQKAGNESNQYQADSITIVNGITEERVRAIFTEQYELARKEYTEEAYRVADERLKKFEDQLTEKITGIDNALVSFSDPAFQFLLRRAQMSAASTERETDYDMLTELLICHIQKGNDRKNRAAINKAVEIVSDIDNDALCGLTIAYALLIFEPITGDSIKGLEVLDDMFKKLLYQELPIGDYWVDHLDVLGAVRITPFISMNSMSECYSQSLNGYICVGIQEKTDTFYKALEILDSVGINSNILKQNELLPGYYRLQVVNNNSINNLVLNHESSVVPISDEQKKALNQIWDLYSNDESLLNQVKDNFNKKIDSFETLHKVRNWWDQIPIGFSITQVGRVLAQTNCKRCDHSLPDLI